MAVEFCSQCNQSLPVGDLTIRNGKVITSNDYVCPHCGRLANPDPAPTPPEPSEDGDIFIRKGDVSQEG